MANKIRTIIVDDEVLARKRVLSLLSGVPEVEIIAECGTGKEAIASITSKKPDLILLDIQMIDMTGFDIINQIDISKMPSIIFITAYDEFALKAFDYFAIDYILKPFRDERFYSSLDKIIKLSHSDQMVGLNTKINNLMNYFDNGNRSLPEFKDKKISIKSRGKLIFIDKDSIIYIQASGYYAEIYTEQKKHLLRESLNTLNEELDSTLFFRIHRSNIINISFIKEVIYSNYGEIDVKMQDDKLFRVSKTYKKEFLEKLGIN